MSLLSAWDRWWLITINVRFHHPEVVYGMALLTRVGALSTVLALTALSVVMVWRRQRRDAVAGGLGVILALALAWWLKEIIQRPRPAEAISGLFVAAGAQGPAFPSGHATGACAVAALVSVLWPRGRLLWWTVALGVAWSRVVLGVHYPSDSVGGALLGSATVFATVGVGRWWAARSSSSRPPHVNP